MNIQKWPKSLQVAVFIFCDLLQESNLVSSAAVPVASGFVMSIWICYVHVCVYAHIHTYTCIIYTLYIWIYIGSVYTFIHNIVYIVSTGDKLNWVQTLARVYLSPAPSVHFKQSGAFIYFFKVHFQCRITVIHWFLGKHFWWEKSDGSQPPAKETRVWSCQGLTWQCQARAWVITGCSGLRAP